MAACLSATFSQKANLTSATRVEIAEVLEDAVPLSQSQKVAGVTGLLVPLVLQNVSLLSSRMQSNLTARKNPQF